MMEFECSNCGAQATVERGTYRFKESGLSNVVLHGIELIRCQECDNVDPIIPHFNDLMRTIASAVAMKPYRLRGEDVRFLRKYLRMTGAEFSRLLDVDKTTLSKWENDEDPVGDQSDRLIRMIALALGDGLKEKLEEVIRSFPQIHKSRKRLQVNVNTQTLAFQYG